MPSLESNLRKWRGQRADSQLFRALARAHGLSRVERQVLVHLADGEQLVRTSEVFVRPSLFESSADARRIPVETLEKLAQRLFGELPAEARVESPKEIASDTESRTSADAGPEPVGPAAADDTSPVLAYGIPGIRLDDIGDPQVAGAPATARG